MPGTHRIGMAGVRVERPAAAHDARQQTLSFAQAVVLAGLLVGFLEVRHEPPDREIAVRQLGDCLGAGPALAGALPPR
jgi:hypothetical protein